MKLLRWISFSVVLGLIVSCYPEKDRSLNDYDIVGTKYADEVVFKGNYQTFYLYDSVILVYDSTDKKPEYPVSEANAVISTLRNNLINYGWTEITRDQVLAGDTPDVYIESSTWNNTVSGAIYYPGWGGYYPGYPFYPYYPSWGATYYSYTTGTVLISMMDIKNYDFQDEPAKLIWTGGLNGILSTNSSTSNTVSRIESSINQAFKQSAYLNLIN